MTVREIVKEYLQKNGFDGLMGDCDLSGCSVSGDFMECDYGDCMYCVPAYLKSHDDCSKCRLCDPTLIAEYDFMFCIRNMDTAGVSSRKYHEILQGMADSLGVDFTARNSGEELAAEAQNVGYKK